MSRGTVVAAAPVSDGRRVRWTLEQQRGTATDVVRVDWLRFTLPLGAVVPWQDRGEVDARTLGEFGRRERELVLASRLAAEAGEPLGAMYVCAKAARMVCDVLGVFEVGQPEERGQDFYLSRAPLVHEGLTVGYVLAGSDKSDQQAGTVHVNLFGAACLHVSHAKWSAVARWVREAQGWITRCDLALDLFDGLDITGLPALYLGGAFDVRGQRPKQREAGSWTSGHSRTFYVGRRETGKELRVYEKGDELFGPEEGDPWVRAEVEFRNNARVIDPAILERPADFFAGAYEWCAELVASESSAPVEPTRIPAGQRLKDASAAAMAVRVVRHGFAQAFRFTTAAMRYAGEAVDNVLAGEWDVLPARLRGWSEAERVSAFKQAFGAMVPAAGQLKFGT